MGARAAAARLRVGGRANARIMRRRESFLMPHSVDIHVGMRIRQRRWLAGMTQQKLDAILVRQMPDHEKRKRSNFVVPTGLGIAYTNRRLRRTLNKIRQCRNVM